MESEFDSKVWESHAKWWQEWFTEGADAEYVQQILPLIRTHLAGASRVLDIGCGEGQVCRVAQSVEPSPALVVGVDSAMAQLQTARDRHFASSSRNGQDDAKGGVFPYFLSDATILPFADGAFDAAVSVLVLEHIEDLDAAISEVARILAPKGRFLCVINHPLLQTPGSGWIDDHILNEQYWRIGPYLRTGTTLEEVDSGVTLPFAHRPLSAYVNLLAKFGLFVTEMQEPPPPPGFLSPEEEASDAVTIPRLLFLRSERL